MSMCISVKKFQRTKFDVSQKPLIQKMHTEPEILNWMRRGSTAIKMTDLPDLPASRIWRALHESVNFVHDPEKQYKSLSVAHRPGEIALIPQMGNSPFE